MDPGYGPWIWTLDMDPGIGCLGHGYWVPGTWVLGAWDMGYSMGWALAIPRCTTPGIPSTTPGTPLPTPGTYMDQLDVRARPAQRLAHSVKTAVSGRPIYRQADN